MLYLIHPAASTCEVWAADAQVVFADPAAVPRLLWTHARTRTACDCNGTCNTCEAMNTPPCPVRCPEAATKRVSL